MAEFDMSLKDKKISNMMTRIISGIIFALVMIGLVWAGGIVCTIGFFFISLIAFYELMDVFGLNNKKYMLYVLLGDCMLIIHYIFIGGGMPHVYILFFATVLFFMLAMLISIIDYPKHTLDEVTKFVVAYLYGAILLSFVPMTRNLAAPDEKGIYIYGFFFGWMILISAWASDTFAYFVGVAIGKHKAFPTLSPKKSWEGCIGGLIGAAAAGLFYGLVLKWTGHAEFGKPRVFMFIGLFCSFAGQAGDLVASGIKRRYGIKDFGKLIPGHGGIMDRFDSVAFIAPMIYLYAYSMLNDPYLWK
ncbi:MAG: phosphatidate cytidylyltransferase [Lachnospiraceae bacterium]|nr:phosphatidate cytidylyltransferase [Lachnospiraceae bacterium]